ncbi:ABC transporter substrate-binding protein [Gulosibacter faecalis]|jgi:peptide/nickel transport system substrate-binding protein|uniref:ABC transporter substrate-binding protein n=1 Tax=Gulosibacter faecalis TaxID=272240 RepID=A0ABW5UVA0_9MICO|nr:ABC transporter substrate-binding protein [Gulosibacter faecalis]
MRISARSTLFRTAAALTAAAVGLTLSPASPVLASETEEASASTMRIATSGFIDSFNPFTSIYLTPTNALRYFYENLVQYSAEDGSPTEGLAESWETEEDGARWVYHIREGMQWSDGEPITSEDVKWTYDQMMNDEIMATANGSLVSNFESVEAPDDQTLVINLIEPQAPVPGVEIPVVPEHVWSQIDNPGEFANDSEVVGSGPFVLESYSPNEGFIMTANENFWRGKPGIDRLQYVYYTDADASIQALRAGDIDFISGLTPTQFNALEGQEGITTVSGEGRRYTSIALNPGQETRDGEAYGSGNPALHDVKVRQAIRQGIDAQALLDNVLDGQGVLATSFVPASYATWMLPEDDDAIMQFDPEAAAALLDEAGWTEGANGIREKDGETLSLTLQIDASDPTEQALAEYVKPWMADIGIDLQVESTDSDTVSANATAGNYDMYFSGWSLGPDPDYQLSINTCANLPTDTEGNGGTTQDGYCDEEFDALYDQQRVELDEDARVDLVHQMLAMNYTSSVQVALYYPNQLEAYRSDRFEGFTTMPTENGIIANQSGYWGFQSVTPVGEGGSSGASQTGLWIVIGGIVVVAVIVVIVVVSRRKKSADIE